MAKSKETTVEERRIILKLHKELKSEREIPKIVSKPRSTINSIIKRFRETGRVIDKSRSGAPRKVDDRLRSNIIRQVKKNPKISAPTIAANVGETLGVQLSAQTIRNVLIEDDYHGRNARKKAFVSKANRIKRTTFAVAHADKPQSFWNKVIWSDESKFELFSSNRREKVWRKPNTALDPKHLTATVKHGGGSVMVWGCMAASGVGKLIFIDGKMDQFLYKRILQENLLSSARQLNMEADFVFQQDNDPKHTAKSVKKWLSENIENVLNWPSQSPDINPIEHLWDHLDRKKCKKNPKSIAALKTILQDEWKEISAEVTKKLVDSMPRRLQAVRDAKGNPTKY